jgi:addiction module HigA family antidote
MARKFSELGDKMSPAATARAKEILDETPNRGLAAVKRSPTHPGEILVDALDHYELSVAEAARRMKIPARRLRLIVAADRNVTAADAVLLGELFDMSPEFWMRLATNYDLWHAMKARRKAKALER